MKVFKKITAFAVAMTTGCSVFAFAACNPEGDKGDGNGKDNGKDNGDKVEINLPVGKPAQAVDATFVSALQEEKDYVSINYTNKRSGTEVNHTETDGVETDTDTTTYEINLTASGKIDLQNGNADLVARSVAAYENDKGKDVSYRAEGYNYIEYDFLRDWNMFSYTTDKEVTDFTGLELSYDGTAKIEWEEILGQLGSIGGNGDVSTYAEEASVPALDLSMLPQTGDLVELSLLGGNVVLVNFAAAANTIEYENGVYSIDLIKTLDTVIKEVGSVVYALKGTNTVGDILNNDIIKKYFSVITELVPVETAKAAVATAIDGLSIIENEYLDAVMLFIQQDVEALKTIDASTTYDYIVSLISSQNTVNILNTVIALMQIQGGASPMAFAPAEVPNAVFTKTLDKYTVSEILTFVNAMIQPKFVTLQVIQNAYKKYVEHVCDGEKIYVDSDNESAITELSVEYKVEGGKLASQKVNYAYEYGRTYGLGYDEPINGSEDGRVETTYYTDTKETQEGTLEITYEAYAPALKDINANAVTYSEYVWNEEDLDWFYLNDYTSDEGVVEKLYVGAIVTDGEYAGYRIYDENKNVVAVGSQVFSVGKAQYLVVEDHKSLGDSYSYVDFVVEKYADVGIYGSARISSKEVEKSSTVAEIIEANA